MRRICVGRMSHFSLGSLGRLSSASREASSLQGLKEGGDHSRCRLTARRRDSPFLPIAGSFTEHWFRPDAGGWAILRGEPPVALLPTRWSTYLSGASFTHDATRATLVQGSVRECASFTLCAHSGVLFSRRVTLVHGTQQPPSPGAQGLCRHTGYSGPWLWIGTGNVLVFSRVAVSRRVLFSLGFQSPGRLLMP